MASKNSRYSDTQLPRPLRAPRPNRTVAARPPAAHDSSKQDRIRSFVEIDDTDSPYALSETVDVVYCDTPTGDLVVDLPSVALANGQILRVCLNSGSGTVTLNPDGADTVDGDTELVIPYVGDVVTLHPRTSESNWRIV